MNNQFKVVVIVPEWIALQIRRDGGEITDIFSYDKASAILSHASMAELLQINGVDIDPKRFGGKSIQELIFGTKPNQEFVFYEPGDDALALGLSSWPYLFEKWVDDTEYQYEVVGKHAAMAKLVNTELEHALFHMPGDGSYTPCVDADKKPWRFLHGDDVIFAIIKPKAFAAWNIEDEYKVEAYKLRQAILSDLMKEQYAYRNQRFSRVTMAELQYIDSLREVAA